MHVDAGEDCSMDFFWDEGESLEATTIEQGFRAGSYYAPELH
jgi:hypothetical protein